MKILNKKDLFELESHGPVAISLYGDGVYFNGTHSVYSGSAYEHNTGAVFDIEITHSMFVLHSYGDEE